MYHVSAQGVDERMINVHYYDYYIRARQITMIIIKMTMILTKMSMIMLILITTVHLVSSSERKANRTVLTCGLGHNRGGGGGKWSECTFFTLLIHNSFKAREEKLNCERF